MSGSTPIGSGNERGNAGIRATQCDAHAGLPKHVDLTVPVPGSASKVQIGETGNIINNGVVAGRRIV